MCGYCTIGRFIFDWLAAPIETFERCIADEDFDMQSQAVLRGEMDDTVIARLLAATRNYGYLRSLLSLRWAEKRLRGEVIASIAWTDEMGLPAGSVFDGIEYLAADQELARFLDGSYAGLPWHRLYDFKTYLDADYWREMTSAMRARLRHMR